MTHQHTDEEKERYLSSAIRHEVLDTLRKWGGTGVENPDALMTYVDHLVLSRVAAVREAGYEQRDKEYAETIEGVIRKAKEEERERIFNLANDTLPPSQAKVSLLREIRALTPNQDHDGETS